MLSFHCIEEACWTGGGREFHVFVSCHSHRERRIARQFNEMEDEAHNWLDYSD